MSQPLLKVDHFVFDVTVINLIVINVQSGAYWLNPHVPTLHGVKQRPAVYKQLHYRTEAYTSFILFITVIFMFLLQVASDLFCTVFYRD